jgi:hypothetical protein
MGRSALAIVRLYRERAAKRIAALNQEDERFKKAEQSFLRQIIVAEKLLAEDTWRLMTSRRDGKTYLKGVGKFSKLKEICNESLHLINGIHLCFDCDGTVSLHFDGQISVRDFVDKMGMKVDTTDLDNEIYFLGRNLEILKEFLDKVKPVREE